MGYTSYGENNTLGLGSVIKFILFVPYHEWGIGDQLRIWSREDQF